MRPVNSGSSTDSSSYKSANISAPEVTSSATLPGSDVSNSQLVSAAIYS